MSRIVESSEEDLARPGGVPPPATASAPAHEVQPPDSTPPSPSAPPDTVPPPQACDSDDSDGADDSADSDSIDSGESDSIDSEDSAAEGEVELDEDGQPVQVDEAHAEVIRQIAKETPEVRFRHSKFYTAAEDRIIAASLAALVPIYKIAETIHCTRRALTRHIENTPILAQLNADRLGKRCDMVEEGLDELTRLRHPSVLMWRAEKLLSDVYGKDRQTTEEDDSILVIGEIPEAGIAEGDAILAAAAAKPPEVGLSALLDERVDPITPSTPQPLPDTPAPAPEVKTSGNPPPPPPTNDQRLTTNDSSSPNVQPSNVQPSTSPQPPPPPAPEPPPPVMMGDSYGAENFGDDGFDDGFGGGNGWLG